VSRLLNGKIDKPYVVISSDDGLRNNIGAARILRAYGISACFFICPSIIGEREASKIADFSRERLHFPPVEFMDWDEVEELMKMGHEIGGHTMNHVNLGQVEANVADSEISECKKVLDAKCGRISHFAYPYGRYTDFPYLYKEFVYRAGFETCAAAERGCHIADSKIDPEQLLIRRDHIILNWPLKHIKYFTIRNSQKADSKNNFYNLA
jgi:peptidoglycan/xylan/chitin deacetylase (PgdA/CDA1 family)